MEYPNVSAKYDSVTFSRKVATRKKGVELMGLGHPLVDALIAHYKSDKVEGEVLLLGGFRKPFVSLHYVFEIDFGDGTKRELYKEILFEGTRSPSEIAFLKEEFFEKKGKPKLEIKKDRLSSVIENIKASIRAEYDDIVNIRPKCVGIVSTDH